MSFRRPGSGPGGFGGFGGQSFIDDGKPSEKYPRIAVPVQSHISQFERQIVNQFLALRETVKDGPLYVGNSTDKGKIVVEIEGLNDGIKRYSDRYIKKRKIGRSVDEHPYVVRFFPEELHSAMGISKKGSSKKKKKMNISKFTRDLINAEKVVGGEGGEGAEDKNRQQSVLDRINQAEAEGASDDDDGEQSEDIDEDFEDDEYGDDDYNAERYFDDGDDFGGGDDDDGDGGEAAF